MWQEQREKVPFLPWLLQYWAQKDIIRDSIHSPHLSDYTERIQVDAARIPREDICKGH